MTGSPSESPTAPFGIRLLLLGLLPVIALAVYLDGQRYAPDRVELRPPTAGPDTALFPESIAGLGRLGQPRRFSKDNLYEYVNGHAEYFIGAGFKALAVGEYGASGADQPALVVNLYDLGAPLNAFGVLVDEAGTQEPADLGGMGFHNARGASFIHGPYYVQITRFGEEVSALAAGRAMAEALQKAVSEPGLAFHFPDLGKVTATRFVKADYRGLGFLGNVLERSFERNGEELQAFLVAGTVREIRELTAAFERFFRDDGINYRQLVQRGLTFYSVDDPYEGEWFFLPLPERLVGVYAPLDETLAGAMADFSQQSQAKR